MVQQQSPQDQKDSRIKELVLDHDTSKMDVSAELWNVGASHTSHTQL